jgi:hypothetical protein
MKVLLYTVFKELAIADVVTRGLIYRSKLRPLVPRRPLRSMAISLKTPGENKRGDGLSKTSSPVVERRSVELKRGSFPQS